MWLVWPADRLHDCVGYNSKVARSLDAIFFGFKKRDVFEPLHGDIPDMCASCSRFVPHALPVPAETSITRRTPRRSASALRTSCTRCWTATASMLMPTLGRAAPARAVQHLPLGLLLLPTNLRAGAAAAELRRLHPQPAAPPQAIVQRLAAAARPPCSSGCRRAGCHTARWWCRRTASAPAARGCTPTHPALLPSSSARWEGNCLWGHT